MAIRTVITRGYGNGTFDGTIALVVTRGYAIGAAIVVVEPAVEVVPTFAAPIPFTQIRIFVRLTASDDVEVRESALLGVSALLTASDTAGNLSHARMFRAKAVALMAASQSSYPREKASMETFDFEMEIDDWITMDALRAMSSMVLVDQD